MKLIHRTLLVWLLLLALPFQGLAAAGMLPCAPGMPQAASASASMTMDGGHHDHAAMPKAVASRTAASAQPDSGHCAPDPHAGKHGGQHSEKAGSCAACCIGAAMAPAVLPMLVLSPSHFISIPFRAGHVPSVDPALPERPPRTEFA